MLVCVTDCKTTDNGFRDGYAGKITFEECTSWSDADGVLQFGSPYNLEDHMFPDGSVTAATDYCRNPRSRRPNGEEIADDLGLYCLHLRPGQPPDSPIYDVIMCNEAIIPLCGECLIPHDTHAVLYNTDGQCTVKPAK